ncbi:MAG: hypothetical protein RSD99_05265, partial [Janthinobacterium sp.]
PSLRKADSITICSTLVAIESIVLRAGDSGARTRSRQPFLKKGCAALSAAPGGAVGLTEKNPLVGEGPGNGG